MKTLSHIPFVASIILVLCVLIGIAGCSTVPSSTTEEVLLDVSIARAVIASQPAGAKRDKLLADFDTAILAGNILLAKQKAAEAAKSTVAATTMPVVK